MATPNIQVILQGILTATNNLVSPAPYIANFDFQNPTLGATQLTYEPYFQATTGGVSVGLPPPKVFMVVVQNLSTTNNLTVTYVPSGGSTTSIVLGPGGVFIYFDPTETGQGISALSLAGVGGTVSAFVTAAA